MSATLAVLLDHLAWADATARAAMDALPADAPQRAEAERLYAHLAAAEHVWWARIAGREPAHAIWPTLAADDAAALAASTVAALRAFVAALPPDGAARSVSYRNSAGQAFASTLREIVAHVAVHGAHHRGQIAQLVRQGGGTPLPMDLIVWARGAPAPARPPR